MILKEEIRLVANKKALEMGCYIVDLKVSTNNQITIFFDKKEGILIDDCSELSKYIEELDTSLDKNRLINLQRQLYTEAQDLEI